MRADALAIGIDIGTSGVRAAAINRAGDCVAQGTAPNPDGGLRDHPADWWQGVLTAMAQLMPQINAASVVALAVDGTSGTVLAVDKSGQPLGRALMYHQAVAPELAAQVSAHAPPESAAHGLTSGLAKMLALQSTEGTARILHQADWVAGCLTGRFDTSDENNALKTGYDPVARRWPDWMARTRARMELLPRVVAPGTPLATLLPQWAARFGLPAATLVCAGTTDGCASFLATGASKAGEAVTALGSTLVVKLLSDRPLFAPEYGIYSHRIGNQWLAGGASNTGGTVLAQFFTPAQIEELSREIDPATSSRLDYYPLARKGERFPVNDPGLVPRLTPRPASNSLFLHGLLEGIARIECLAYQRLVELGAPRPIALCTVGGGARNGMWTQMRARMLGCPMAPARSEEASVGTARLAMQGAL